VRDAGAFEPDRGQRAVDGGEELLIVLPGCDAADAWMLGECLRTLIAGSSFVFAEKQLAVTCSIGCATQPNGESWDADSLIRLADEALYEAKRSGRNCTVNARHELAVA